MLDDVIFVRDTLDLLNFRVCGLELKFIAEALFVVLVSALATWKAGSLGVRASWCAGSLGWRAAAWVFGRLLSSEQPELDREVIAALAGRGVWDETRRELRAGDVVARCATDGRGALVVVGPDDVTDLLSRKSRREVMRLVQHAASSFHELVSDLRRERAAQTARKATPKTQNGKKDIV